MEDRLFIQVQEPPAVFSLPSLGIYNLAAELTLTAASIPSVMGRSSDFYADTGAVNREVFQFWSRPEISSPTERNQTTISAVKGTADFSLDNCDFPPLGPSSVADEVKAVPTFQKHPQAASLQIKSNKKRRKSRLLTGQETEQLIGINIVSEKAIGYGESPLDPSSLMNSRICPMDNTFMYALDMCEQLGHDDRADADASQGKSHLSHILCPVTCDVRTRKQHKLAWSFISRQKVPSSSCIIRRSLRICVESASILNNVFSSVLKRDCWLPTTCRSAWRFLHQHNHSLDSMAFEEGSALRYCAMYPRPTRPAASTSPKPSCSRYVATGRRRSCVCIGDTCHCPVCVWRYERVRKVRQANTSRTQVPGRYTWHTHDNNHRRYQQQQFSNGQRRFRRPVKYEFLAASHIVPEVNTALAKALETLQHREIRPEDYELLLHLDASVANKTAPESLVTTLPSFVFAAEVTTSANHCAICMEEYKDQDTLTKLPCAHDFHQSCIERWLLNSSPNCPLDGLSLA